MLKKVMIKKMNNYIRFCKKYCDVLSNGNCILNIDFKKYLQKERGFIISYNIENKKEGITTYTSCWCTVGKQCEFDNHKFEKGTTLHFYNRIEYEIERNTGDYQLELN